MSEIKQGEPFPSPLTALGLALAAPLIITAVLLPFESKPPIAAQAFALVLGFGALGTLAARFVPAPADSRLGLRPVPLRAILPVALLLPSAFLLSELDNWIRLALHAQPVPGLGSVRMPALDVLLLGVLLYPVLQEFFFRGVLQQGCVARLGARGGVLLVAMLQCLFGVGLLGSDLATGLSQTSQAFVGALLLGSLRLATGSLLPGIAFASALEALGMAGAAFPDRFPIAGFNAPGATTPLVVLLPAAASVALGIRLLAAELAKQPPLPPIPLAQPKDDEEAGPFF